MVALILGFGVVLLIAVSLSGLAARTILSTSLIFLVAGALLGPGGVGFTSVQPGDHIARELPTIALFIVVFTGGQRANWQALKENWPLPGRALGLGMRLTMAGIAVPAHFITDLHWSTSFLFGAILAPTDPVFAAALVHRDDIPQPLRRLLNVESGLNDGLTLPFVLITLDIAQHHQIPKLVLGSQLAGGLLVGFALAAAVTLLWRLPILGPAARLQALGPVAIAVVFQPMGESLSELSKFAALMVFGALITPTLLLDAGWRGWLLAVIAIVVVRIGVMMLSLLRSRLTRRAAHRRMVRSKGFRVGYLRSFGTGLAAAGRGSGFDPRRSGDSAVDHTALLERCAGGQEVGCGATRQLAESRARITTARQAPKLNRRLRDCERRGAARRRTCTVT